MTSLAPNQVRIYGCADMPEADGAAVGGAVDFSKILAFFDMVSAGDLDYVSDSASDTATKIEVAGRDATNAVQTETKTLNGTTIVAGTQSFARLLYGASSGAGAGGPLANPGGTAAAGNIAAIAHTRTISGHTAQVGSANKTGTTPTLMKLQSGDGATIGALTFAGLGLIVRITGGTGANQLRQIAAPYASATYGADVVVIDRDWTTVPDATSTYDIAPGMYFPKTPNAVTAVIRAFSTATADVPGGSTRTFYEKGFVVNDDTAAAALSASVQILSDSPALPGTVALDLALTTVLNDTTTATNRQTAPGGTGGFVVQPSAIAVPAPGNLPPGAAPNAAGAEGCWFRLTAPAGSQPYNGAAEIQINSASA